MTIILNNAAVELKQVPTNSGLVCKIMIIILGVQTRNRNDMIIQISRKSGFRTLDYNNKLCY